MRQGKRSYGVAPIGTVIAIAAAALPAFAQSNNGWSDYQTGPLPGSQAGRPTYPHFPEAGKVQMPPGGMKGWLTGKPSPSIAEMSDAQQWEMEHKQQKEQELREYAHCKAVYKHLFPRSADEPLQINDAAPRPQTAAAAPGLVCPPVPPTPPTPPPHVHQVHEPFLSPKRPGLGGLRELCPGEGSTEVQKDVCAAYLTGVLEAMTADLDQPNLPACLAATRNASESAIMIKFSQAMVEENRAPAREPVYRGNQVRTLIMRAFCSSQ